MRSTELTIGRSFGLTLDHGDDFLAEVKRFCAENRVRQGFIPMFVAGMLEVEMVGSCEPSGDPMAPLWSSIHLANVEAIGCGTIAADTATGEASLHVHVSVGKKFDSAQACTSHLLSSTIQFLGEIYVVEVLQPRFARIPDPRLYDVPLLHFGE